MRKFDVHSHFGPWNTIPIAKHTSDDLVAMLGAAGIERAVVSSVQALLTDLVAGNRATQEAVECHEMLLGYIYVDPHRVREAIREVERLSQHPKFVGIKSRDDYHGLRYNGGEYRDIFRAVRELRLPVLLHTFSVSSMQAAMELASDYPAPVILTHMAGPEWRACRVFAERHVPPNVYVDPVSSASEPGKYEKALELFGEDHLVFGTDCNLFHPGLSIGAIESSELSDDAKRKLYWENAAGIFGT
jgi:predicted TIM-barrel fold metal-dependent hydrolase